MRTQVKEGNELKFHFIGVDAWRRLLFDYDVDTTCRFCLYNENGTASSSAATTLLGQMGPVSSADAYVVMILARHAGSGSVWLNGCSQVAQKR